VARDEPQVSVGGLLDITVLDTMLGEKPKYKGSAQRKESRVQLRHIPQKVHRRKKVHRKKARGGRQCIDRRIKQREK
jgi:hypothetical protein